MLLYFFFVLVLLFLFFFCSFGCKSGPNAHTIICQDMSKCTGTGFKTLENKNKPLVLKELKKLWNKEDPDLPWEQEEFSPSNTLLVDDSPYKALGNPVLTSPLFLCNLYLL